MHVYFRPIHDAIEVGAFDLVKLLIQNGADPLAEQGEKTPAEFALEMDEPEIHDYLQCKKCTRLYILEPMLHKNWGESERASHIKQELGYISNYGGLYVIFTHRGPKARGETV